MPGGAAEGAGGPAGRTVCFVGDSIMLGTGDPAGRGWPGRLWRRENDRGRGYSHYNLGVRSDTSRNVARRWLAECMARMAPGAAGAIVFGFGVNDATEEGGRPRVPLRECVATAESILGRAREIWPVLFVGPAPVDESRQPRRVSTGELRHKRNSAIAAYDAALSETARGLEIPYCSLFRELIEDAGWPGMLADGVHPAEAGCDRIAGFVAKWPAWRQLLAEGGGDMA